ncbi:tubulin-like doman-containing protein [Kitasatospora sp. NPDC088346]|uniref:tubulin-like doman-containing protein n=1 Tax=Kitasatospora sp. NPDC088346 TaxID=3364073 RepID=UPI00381D0823
MKVFQPMLFVGLGGTGGQVGSELERRLRAELCGPDGTALSRIGVQLPYQLPECLQFVYADFSEAELDLLPLNSVGDPALRTAFRKTARVTHDLLPPDDSSSEVNRVLRAKFRRETESWLPPERNEPRVTPLSKGAGQLPTIGRAALYGTLQHSLKPIMDPLTEAIDAISRSGPALSQLGGNQITGCDVFVSFSVAGGTGAGIFLDYLHLIAQAFKQKGFRGVKIYPLVVMPSAFPAEAGGGPEAELNAARSLVDLFRLVDEQNRPVSSAQLGDVDEAAGGLQIRYPRTGPIRMRPGLMPTGFLFSRTAGIRPDDLRRSIVSLVMSLIGTELGDSPSNGGVARESNDQTFASSFLNRGQQRTERAASGIGYRGVSTSLVASLTVPLDELAEVMSARMLAVAVDALVEENRPSEQPLRPLLEQMFTSCGLSDLWHRPYEAPPDPAVLPRGGTAIEQELQDRIVRLETQVDNLRKKIARTMPALVHAFTPLQAMDEMLNRVNPFDLGRIVMGERSDPDRAVQQGLLGMLQLRSRPPARPSGVSGEKPPSVPRIRGSLLARSRWADPEVQAAVDEQDRWYAWRCHAAWHSAWAAQRGVWEHSAKVLEGEVRRLTSAFLGHIDEEKKTHKRAVQELYQDRTGVAYLLPSQSDLREFYGDMADRLSRRHGLDENDDEATLLLKLVGPEQWAAAVQAVRREKPEVAVGKVKAVVEKRIKTLFAERLPHQEERPLLPSMGVLLAAAAGDRGAAAGVGAAALAEFGHKIKGLLPIGFSPEGNGRMQVLIVYPQAPNRQEVEDYLRRVLPLPRDTKKLIEFRGVETESITVVLFRSEMSITEVPEAREVLRSWARAARRNGTMLNWRQRLGYQDNWLASTEDDRTYILYRLLCAMWNGQVEVLEGDQDSPERIRIWLTTDTRQGQPGITLTLDEYQDGMSSWVGLLRSYERWALLDEGTIVDTYCSVLMQTTPHGLDRPGSKPHPLFVHLVEKVAPQQLQLLSRREQFDDPRITAWLTPLLRFWSVTLPAALDVDADQQAFQVTLRDLLDAFRGGEPPRRRRRPVEAGQDRREDRRPADEDFGTQPLAPVPPPRPVRAYDDPDGDDLDEDRPGHTADGHRAPADHDGGRHDAGYGTGPSAADRRGGTADAYRWEQETE